MDTASIAFSTYCLRRASLAESFAMAERLGFSAIGLYYAPDGLGPGIVWDELNAAAQADLVAARSRFARGSMHAPATHMPLVSPNPHIEREALRQILAAVRAAGALRLDAVVVHALTPAEANVPEEAFTARLVANLRTLGDEAARQGTRIGVENIRYPTAPDEHARLLDLVDHPAVGATVDVGHVNFWFQRDGIAQLPLADGADWYNARLLQLIDGLGERIVHLHLQDIALPTMADQHLPLGRGMIDFEAVIGRLRRWGYSGLLELEHKIEHEQDVVTSRTRLEQALSATASELVAG